MRRALLLAVLGFACRTAGETQRMEIAATLNVYKASKAAYVKACQPTPEAQRAPCWVWRDNLTACFRSMEAAQAAAKIGKAVPQFKAMRGSCADLQR